MHGSHLALEHPDDKDRVSSEKASRPTDIRNTTTLPLAVGDKAMYLARCGPTTGFERCPMRNGRCKLESLQRRCSIPAGECTRPLAPVPPMLVEDRHFRALGVVLKAPPLLGVRAGRREEDGATSVS